jgi:hypothetical protein
MVNTFDEITVVASTIAKISELNSHSQTRFQFLNWDINSLKEIADLNILFKSQIDLLALMV